MALSKEEGSLRETVETSKALQGSCRRHQGNEEMLNEGLGDAELERWPRKS